MYHLPIEGLRREDLIMEEYPGVREALRRLPQEELDKRNYRMARALDLSMKHRILPESEWTNTDEVGIPLLASFVILFVKVVKLGFS